MKVSYDTSWLPPAPFLPVQLASLAEHSAAITVQARLDTGADLTAIPYALDVLNRLRLLLDGPALTTEILAP
jgi:hypothetical protein